MTLIASCVDYGSPAPPLLGGSSPHASKSARLSRAQDNRCLMCRFSDSTLSPGLGSKDAGRLGAADARGCRSASSPAVHLRAAQRVQAGHHEDAPRQDRRRSAWRSALACRLHPAGDHPCVQRGCVCCCSMSCKTAPRQTRTSPHLSRLPRPQAVLLCAWIAVRRRACGGTPPNPPALQHEHGVMVHDRHLDYPESADRAQPHGCVLEAALRAEPQETAAAATVAAPASTPAAATPAAAQVCTHRRPLSRAGVVASQQICRSSAQVLHRHHRPRTFRPGARAHPLLDATRAIAHAVAAAEVETTWRAGRW